MRKNNNYWISQESAARYLYNTYKKLGSDITYEQILSVVYDKCERGEIPCISIPYYMSNKAHLN